MMAQDSSTETSAAIVIDNSDPTADTEIGPMAAVYGEDVVCSLINDDDADNDTVSISVLSGHLTQAQPKSQPVTALL